MPSYQSQPPELTDDRSAACSADEMLAALKERLPNDAATELKNAATEQSKITKIRLEKLEI